MVLIQWCRWVEPTKKPKEKRKPLMCPQILGERKKLDSLITNKLLAIRFFQRPRGLSRIHDIQNIKKFFNLVVMEF